MATIRERIESLIDGVEKTFGIPDPITKRERFIVDLFKSGQLIPADEHQAAVEAARREERERIYAILCKRCKAGNLPFWLHGANAYVHDMALSTQEGMRDCDATELRAALRREKE